MDGCKNLPVHEIGGVKKSDFLFDDVFYGRPPSKSKSLERQPSWPWKDRDTHKG